MSMRSPIAPAAKSLTGETYIKRQHGPVSKHAQKILGERLEHENAIVIGSFDRFGKQMRGYIRAR